MQKIQVQCEHCDANPVWVLVDDNSIFHIHTCPECGSDTVVTTEKGKVLTRIVEKKSREIQEAILELTGLNCEIQIQSTEKSTKETHSYTHNYA